MDPVTMVVGAALMGVIPEEVGAVLMEVIPGAGAVLMEVIPVIMVIRTE
jgi:hypothetical protein